MHAYADDSRKRAIRLTGRVRLEESGARESWNQVAYEGEWNGHAAGPFQFTRDIFERIIANFRRREEGIGVTYGHPRDGVQAAYTGQAGRVVDLRIGEDHKGRGASLEALIRFTERAAEMVRAGELQHCSVVVGFESVDEVTGEDIGPELYELGLVVQPFLADMRPLQLSAAHRGATNERKLAMSIKDILLKAAEELADDASIEAVEAYIEGAMKQAAAVEGKLDEDAEEAAEMGADSVAASAEPPPAGNAVAAEEPMANEEMAKAQAYDFVTAAAAELGTDFAGALALMQERVADILALLAGATDGGTSADDVAAMSRTIAALNAQVKELSADLRTRRDAEAKAKAEAEAAQKAAKEAERVVECGKRIDAAIEAGDVSPQAREGLLALSRRGDDVLDEALATMKAAGPAVKVPTGRAYEPSGRTVVAAGKSEGDGKRVALERLTPKQRYEYDCQLAIHKDHERALKSALSIN